MKDSTTDLEPATPTRSRGWQCGDRRELRRAVSHFAQRSSLHGVRNLCSGTKKVFYRVFFAGCTACMLASVAFLVQESWSTESVYISSTSKEGVDGPAEDPFYPRYPRITFCRRPGYEVDGADPDLLRYAFLSLGYPFPSFTPHERTLMIGIKVSQRTRKGASLPPHLSDMDSRLKDMEERYDAFKSLSGVGFDLARFIVDNSARCEDIFIRCIALVFDLNCTEIFRPVLTAMGTCFSVEVGDALSKMNSDSLQFTLTFDLRAAPGLEKAVSIGYEVYLSDPRNREGIVVRAGQTLMNGYATVMKTRLVKTSRTAFFTPWHGLYHHCPRLPVDLDPMGYGDRYFRAACDRRYQDRMMRQKCSCRFVTESAAADPIGTSPTARQCDPVDVYDCFVAFALHDNMTGLAKTCVPPCLEYQYESDVNFAKIGTENVRLTFIYDGTQYALQEYRKTTLSSFLSQIGGALGLYVGASVITVVETLTFAASYFRYRFWPLTKEEERCHFC